MTTSTRSADATGLPDRRRFISTIAGAGALGLPALPVLAAAPDHPDAALIEIDRLLTDAVALYTDLGVQCDEAMEDFEDPTLPDSLFWQKRDFPSVWVDRHRLDSLGDPDSGAERYTYASHGVLDKLRVRLAEWKAVPFVDRFSFTDRDVARVEEIVGALEAHHAEEARRLAACGYTAVAQQHDAQWAVVAELYDRLARMRARTADGVSIKTRAALTASHRIADLLELHQLGPLLAKTDRHPYETAELLTLSAMIDAARLGKASSGDRRAA